MARAVLKLCVWRHDFFFLAAISHPISTLMPMISYCCVVRCSSVITLAYAVLHLFAKGVRYVSITIYRIPLQPIWYAILN